MKKDTGIFASSALPLLLILGQSPAFVHAAAEAEAPAAEEAAIPLHPRFRSHLKCPYAERWLAKGPERASRELGLDHNGRKLQHGGGGGGRSKLHGRKLQEAQPVQGSCTYMNAWTGASTCMQFAGTAWTEDDMATRCDKESGEWSAEGCGESAGWCENVIAEGKSEVTAMALSPAADCGQNEMACKTFMGGNFMADGECLTDETSSEEVVDENIFGEDADAASMGGGPPPGVVTGEGGGSWPGAAPAVGGGDDASMKCLLAPGAIGAAHQAGFSKGYSASCPGTPAQESPYMWPLKWAADSEGHSMAYGSDDVVFTTRGRTFYMLDKNWKRSDTTYQEGVIRALGQGPCDGPNSEFIKDGCVKNQTDGSISTMIHRENLMYFISWKDDAENPAEAGERDASKIEECTMLNLAVVGNIRPDWFLDKRGDDTDVQYLGDQHVFYADGAVPKLVKQWRKKDFASQYFVMSMMGNPPNYLEKDPNAPVEDDVHWPLILNIPGEGFGDDSLQVYRNHALLTEEDEELFTLIERYEASGGVCVDIRAAAGGGDVGPPVQEDHETIPSNLEVDPLSWLSNEITFSPIWEIPAREVGPDGSMMASGGKSVVEASNRVTVESCYDDDEGMMDMSIHFHDMEPAADGSLPWMAIGYRASDLCAMTPPQGGTTPIVMVTQASEEVAPEAHKTELVPEAKAMDQDAFASMYASMKPLGEVEEYMSVSVEAPMAATQIARSASPFAADDTVSLHFKQMMDGDTEVMNLLYAIGMNSQLGIHTTRGCFQVPVTPCPKAGNIGDEEKLTIDLTGALDGVDQSESEKENLSIDLSDGSMDNDASIKSSSHVVSLSIMSALAIGASIMIGL